MYKLTFNKYKLSLLILRTKWTVVHRLLKMFYHCGINLIFHGDVHSLRWLFSDFILHYAAGHVI